MRDRELLEPAAAGPEGAAACEAGDGRRLRYLDHGPRVAEAGPPLVLLHGWACHGGYFFPQMEALAARRRLIAPDLRGHRGSWRAGDAPGLGRLAEDLEALLGHLALPRPPVLLGWSMGALVAFEHLRRRGAGGLAGLVVVDMTPRVLNDAGWRLGLRGSYAADQVETAAGVIRREWPFWVETFLPSIFAAGRTPDPALLAWVGAEMHACDPGAMAALWRDLSLADYRADLAGLALPSLILRGAESRLYGPETAAWFVEAMPGAEAAAVPEAGHAPQLEQPEAFNRLLDGFLARVG